MKDSMIKRGWGLLAVLITFLLILPFPGVMKAGEIPSVDDVIKGKAKLPTIEDLTDGKVKIGDLIDKNNVDLVQEYISPGIYAAVKQGMVMKMGTQLPADKLVPKYFIEATEKNKGKAIIDKNGTTYYKKVGTLWPGGLPFIEPKNGLEVMAAAKYGIINDDLHNYPIKMRLISRHGKVYKSMKQEHRWVFCNARKDVAPLGTIPGYGDIMYKRINIIHSPLELKGLGQYTTRYYDDAKNYDTGFAYLPAFKRMIRISVTSWQDNIGGSDVTYGDGMGLQSPYSNWKFRLIRPRYFLLHEPNSPIPVFNSKGKINKNAKFDEGEKFIRLGWTIWPVWEVEAIPKVKHIYSKKVLFVQAWPYWTSISPIRLAEMYDRQGKLWKFYIGRGGDYQENLSLATDWGNLCPDFQSGHVTQMWYVQKISAGYKPDDITIKTLLELGR